MDAVTVKNVAVPALGFGTWALSGNAAYQATRMVLDLGYRHIDTAQIYGNEAEIGRAIRDSGLPRGEIFLTTKIAPSNLRKADVRHSHEESLKRLGLDHVDLLLIHWPNPRIPVSETLGAMIKMKREGYAKQIGVSNFTVALLDEANAVCSELVCNQIEYHPFLNQDKVVAACKRHGMAIVAYSPIARGGAKGNDVLTRIGKEHRKSAAQVSLRYLVQQGIAVIPRTSKLERLEENFAVFDFTLTDEEMREIAGLARRGGRIVDWTWSPKWD